MPKIPTIFEQELRNQAPALLDDAFLDRLTACAEGTDTDMPEEAVKFAAMLGGVKLRPLPSAFHASLLDAIGETPFSLDGKIVLFHKQSKPGPAKTRSFSRFNIAAAAAVALLGALAAFMVPGGTGGETTTDNGKPGAANPILKSHFVPASYGRNLSETRDEGVIWRGKNQPHRVWRLTFTDMVTMKNGQGETYQEERPRYEYVIIPEKID